MIWTKFRAVAEGMKAKYLYVYVYIGTLSRHGAAALCLQLFQFQECVFKRWKRQKRYYRPNVTVELFDLQFALFLNTNYIISKLCKKSIGMGESTRSSFGANFKSADCVHQIPALCTPVSSFTQPSSQRGSEHRVNCLDGCTSLYLWTQSHPMKNWLFPCISVLVPVMGKIVHMDVI